MQCIRRTTAMRRVVQTIALTPTEKRLFALLVDVAKRRSPGTTVRVAGGWVRDKLLGLPGRDIDIVLDDTSGARFAKHVVAHQRAAASRGAGDPARPANAFADLCSAT